MDALVVDRWADLAEEEVDEPLRAKITQRFVELRGDVGFEPGEQRGPALGGKGERAWTDEA